MDEQANLKLEKEEEEEEGKCDCQPASPQNLPDLLMSRAVLIGVIPFNSGNFEINLHS